MANEPENRMLFDLRGRRRRVIQVIYVMLAFIMAASLLVIGLPGGVNPFGNTSSVVGQDAAELSIERAERIEERLAANPNNKNAQQELIRARITAGRNLVEVSDDGQQTIGDAATVQYDLAAQAWEDYLKQTNNNPDPTVAQLVSGTLFDLAQNSTVAQFEANIRDATEAQRFVAESTERLFDQGEGPSPTGQLTRLAELQYYSQDFEAAERTRRRALESTQENAERQQVTNQLNFVKQEAERVGRIITRAKRQARQEGGSSLQSPIEGLDNQVAPGAAGAQP